MRKTKKTIYMNDSLILLSEKTKGASRRTGQFSGRLARIVDRYMLFLELTPVPPLTAPENELLASLISKKKPDRQLLASLPSLIRESTPPSENVRTALLKKTETLSCAERLALIEEAEP